MIAAALLATAALAGAHPAQAAPVCHGQFAPAPPDPNASIKRFMEQRAEFGFRADEAYVRLLIKRGVWEYDVGYIPVTPRENRYLKLRDELELGAKADRYLNRHTDVDGGTSIEDDWPRDPYLLVRITRDRKLHERALKRLARRPELLRTRHVRYSYRQLRQVQDKVWRDAKALKKAGFIVEGSSPDVLKNRVEVELITHRTDGADYFKRYGPVKAIVVATEPTYLDCVESTGYEIAPDGRGLVVGWATTGTAKPERIELSEQPDRVTVGAVVRLPNGLQTDDLRPNSQPVALSAPLGDRPVFDAATGKRLLQHGPSPGESACPVVPPLSRLDEAIRTRLERGLPAGREYVQRMLRRRIPYSASELRWFERKQSLADRPRVDAYLSKHDDESGGSSVEGRYPETPYLLVRVTGHRALHAARLKRISRQPIRVVTVAHTATELETLASRINTDAAAVEGFVDGYGDAGFYFRGARSDEATNSVAIGVITPRSDAQPYFQARYGPLVRVTVRGTRFECATSALG